MAPTPHPAPAWSSRHPVLVFVLKTAAGALLLAGLIWYVDIHALIVSVTTARPGLLALGTLLAAVNIGIQFLRWKFLVTVARVPGSDSSIFKSLAAGFTAGFFTPGQIGEIGGRLYSLDPAYRGQILMMSAVDKLYILGATIAAGMLSALVYFPLYLPAQWGSGAATIAILILCAVTAGFLFPSLTKRLLLRLPRKIRNSTWYGAVSVFETDFHNSTGQWLMVLTSVYFGIIILQYHCFVNAFSEASLAASALSVPIVLFVKSVILPISIGDLGIRESASVFFYGQMGIPAAAALNASLCIFAVNIVFPSLMGIIVLFLSNKR